MTQAVDKVSLKKMWKKIIDIESPYRVMNMLRIKQINIRN
jgi:hypothetical protein